MADIQDTYPVPDDDLEAGRGSPQERALARFEQHVRDNAPTMAELRREATEMARFCSPRGRQFPEKIYQLYEELGLPTLSLNEVWPTIMNLAGREITGRYVPKLVGRDTDDQGFADACNAVVRTIRERNDFEAVDSAAYRNAHIKGYSATELHIRPKRQTPEFLLEKVPADELLLDFSSLGVNWKDGTAISRGRFVTHWQLKTRWPELARYWEGIKGDTSHHFNLGASSWASAIGRSLVESEEGSWGWSSESLGVPQAYCPARDAAFLVNFLWSDSEPMVALRLPGEVAAIWERLTGDELPYESGDLDGPAPFMEELEPLETLLEALGVVTAQAEQALQQMAEQYQQVAAATPEGQEPPPPPQPQPLITRTITGQQLREFQRGYGLLGLATYEEYFEVDEDIWWQALIVGQKVLRVKRIGHKLPTILPLICYHDEEEIGQMPYGTGKLLQARQMWANAFANAYVYALATITKAQVMLNPTGLTSSEVEDFVDDMTRGTAVLRITNPDAVHPVPGKQDVPAGIERAFDLFQGLVAGGVGASAATTGSLQELSRTAYRLAEQQASLAQQTVAEAVDNLRAYRRAQTRLLLSCVFTYWSRDDFATAAGDHARHIPMDRSEWWRALDFDLIVDEEPVTRHMALANLETAVQTGFYQIMPEEALVELTAPAFGSKVQTLWQEKLAARAPEIAAENLAAAFGLDPQMVLQHVQQLAESAQLQSQTGEVA